MNVINSSVKNLGLLKGRIISIVMSLISISLAHYAGFLSHAPNPIVAAAGRDLIIGVTGTFIFYISFCSVISMVIVNSVLPYSSVFGVFASRAVSGLKLKSMSRKKRFVKEYNSTMKKERPLSSAAQALFILILMSGLYIDFEFSLLSASVLSLATVLIVLSLLFRSKFLLVLSAKKLSKRLKSRPSEKVNMASETLFTIVSASVVAAFVLGAMRINMLINSSPQQITTPYFKGYGNLLASSGSSVFILERSEDQERYMYLTPDYALSIESETGTFPLLGNDSNN
ncbi:hypothetical protein [Idiomarina abyssalis]|uniref:hypothetical protein n=1 Tax=Idiomarina abyssalis TaxID=86102 RepID=UPI003A8FAF5B